MKYCRKCSIGLNLSISVLSWLVLSWHKTRSLKTSTSTLGTEDQTKIAFTWSAVVLRSTTHLCCSYRRILYDLITWSRYSLGEILSASLSYIPFSPVSWAHGGQTCEYEAVCACVWSVECVKHEKCECPLTFLTYPFSRSVRLSMLWFEVSLNFWGCLSTGTRE